MARIGINRRTGQVLTGWAHVVQSIEDILSTRVMSRVMRRPYGSDAPKLIDAPTNAASLMAVRVAIAEALARWEPGFELTRVVFTAAGADGAPSIALAGVYYPDGHLGDRTPDTGIDRTVTLMQINESTWRAAA